MLQLFDSLAAAHSSTAVAVLVRKEPLRRLSENIHASARMQVLDGKYRGKTTNFCATTRLLWRTMQVPTLSCVARLGLRWRRGRRLWEDRGGPRARLSGLDFERRLLQRQILAPTVREFAGLCSRKTASLSRGTARDFGGREATAAVLRQLGTELLRPGNRVPVGPENFLWNVAYYLNNEYLNNETPDVHIRHAGCCALQRVGLSAVGGLPPLGRCP